MIQSRVGQNVKNVKKKKNNLVIRVTQTSLASFQNKVTNVITNIRHKATNVITDKHHNVTNVISDKHHKVTNVISNKHN